MTPLEIAAEAYEQERELWGVRDSHLPKRHEVVRTDPDEDFIFISDRFDNLADAREALERIRAMASMAEALRALADADLGAFDKAVTGPSAMRTDASDRAGIFRVLLRAISNAGKEQ